MSRDSKGAWHIFHSLSLTCKSIASELRVILDSASEPHVQIQSFVMSVYAAGLCRQAEVVTISTRAAAIHLQADGEYKSARVSLTGDLLQLRSETHKAIQPATISYW